MDSRIACILACLAMAVTPTHAQAPAATPAGEKSLAATLNVYVFPTAGQPATQQSKDEGECYQWAVTNTGSDPFDVQKQKQAQVEQAEAAKQQAAQAGKGAGVKGAAGGAAVGALVGEIASDDAGEGAAWGAAVGGVAARRRAKAQQQQATQQVAAQEQQIEKTSEEQIANFKKAFSVCLEAKKYMVKF